MRFAAVQILWPPASMSTSDGDLIGRVAQPAPTSSSTRKSGFLLWCWPVEWRIHLIFLDALRRITALSEVLLFPAVAHHSQMDSGPGLFGVFFGVLWLRSVGHREILCVGGFGLAPAMLEDHPTRHAKSVRVGIYSSHRLGFASLRSGTASPASWHGQLTDRLEHRGQSELSHRRLLGSKGRSSSR